MGIKNNLFKNLKRYESMEDFLRVEIYDIIKKSGLFDEEFYINSCPDIKKYGWDCYDHYVHIGVYQNYNPNNHFDSKWYLENYPDVKEQKINPFLHYILWGKDEGRYESSIDKNKQ